MGLRLLVLIISTALSGCLESSFELASESRLPKWFEIPEGASRSDLTVEMDLHSTFSGSKAVFMLFQGKSIFSIQKYTVTSEDQPAIRSVQLDGSVDGYPRYKVVTINGLTDVIELRKMEPYFYMSDDEAVWEQLIGLSGKPVSTAADL